MTASSILLSRMTTGFTSLKGSPSELWKAYAMKFLESFGYFSFSIVCTLFLSDDFGYSDMEAGTIYGAWGALITVYGVFGGYVQDNMGVAFSLRVGFMVSLLSRISMFITSSKPIILLNLFVLLPFGTSLGIPVLTTCIRRYTHESNRGFAFGLFYVVMNVAALFSGPVADFCTVHYSSNSTSVMKTSIENMMAKSHLPNETTLEWKLSGYRLIILVGIFANIIAFIISLTINEIKVDSNSKPRQTNTEKHDLEKEIQKTTTSTFQPIPGGACEILQETIQSPDFWRFFMVCCITINVRMIFRHLDATLPKFMMREFGPDVAKGTIYSINPALIIILVPIITAASTEIDPLVMIHHGSYISALSVFFLVFSTSIPSCILFVIFLSIGEAIWSPRLYDYTMSVTKEGREGIYMALSSAPVFLAKLPVGIMSGYLLEKFCPEKGVRRSKIMWLIIGLSTIISPLLLTACWKFVSKVEKNNDANDTEMKPLVLKEDNRS